MQPDPVHVPGQENEEDDLNDLLLEALDGADLQRAALILRLTLMRGEPDRAADLDALRRDGLPPVYRA
ncbi:hypothetical protein SR39_01205 [Methylobacterium radiotolerans]|jgi:hypothetical protein|nr:hypothetical protein SR39_01205 [Methylobacterium radiotolerans]